TKGIIAALYRKFSDVVGPGTEDICYATQNRQMALRELSKAVDVIFVVGAANSSNSNRLREIGLEAGIGRRGRGGGHYGGRLGARSHGDGCDRGPAKVRSGRSLLAPWARGEYG